MHVHLSCGVLLPARRWLTGKRRASGRLTSGSRPGQAVPSPFCQRSKDEGKMRPKFTKCEKINIFEHATGFRPPVAMAKPKWRQILLSLKHCSAMSPLRKGSRCRAPALCLSQWRRWVYATFHQWDKENHRSSCNGGIFRVFRAGGFEEINRRWRNFNYSNREVLDLPVGGRNKKENTESYLPVFAVLPSWNDEKEEHFLASKSDRYDMENGGKNLNFEQNHFWWKFNKMGT